ncbi:diguanylate cyclase [Dechloromonas sp. A34]|uniref:diguanylate cyclase n=1 Tax=Dechloromonas sp. A34 TaxID=447588 RepID=UPI00224916A4|nr:diguanylate cyclase [Dechloromonas sp. A34]
MTKLPKVLIVDASRVVRASLAKYLRGSFNVCEEGGAESAWQTLVLDSSIIAVVSGLDITHLEGAGLVERLRASKLPRLNRLPFFLLVSDSFAASGHHVARQLGVSEFVPKKTAGPALKNLLLELSCSGAGERVHAGNPDPADPSASELQAAEFGSQSEVGLGDFISRVGRLAGLTGEPFVDNPAPTLGLGGESAEHCLQSSLSEIKGAPPGGALVFGLDGYENFRLRYGSEVADSVVLKFSRLLASKIRSNESVLHLVGGRVAIISSTAGREQCVSFAKRICKALAAAKISLRGERVVATVSAGVAALPEDSAATTTDELLRLAVSRLDAAVQAGGNRVVFVTGCGGNSVSQDEFFERLRELLAEAGPETMMSCKGWVTSICGACRSLRTAGKASLCPSDAAGEQLCSARNEEKC